MTAVHDGEPAPDFGTHCLVDAYGCASEILDDPAALAALLEEAANLSGLKVLATHHHRFSPQGASALCFLAESHISIHTWPERRIAMVDIYTCGAAARPLQACDHIVTALQPDDTTLSTMTRGAADAGFRRTAGYVPSRVHVP